MVVVGGGGYCARACRMQEVTFCRQSHFLQWRKRRHTDVDTDTREKYRAVD